MPSFSKNKNCQSCCNKRVNSACSVPRLSCSRLCPGTRYTTKVSDLPGVALVYLCVPDRQPQWHKQSRVVGACRVYMYTRFHCVHTPTAGSAIDWSQLPHHAPCIPTHVVSFTRVWERGTSVVFIWVLGSLSLTLSYDRRSAWQHCNMRDTLYLPSQGLYDSV